MRPLLRDRDLWHEVRSTSSQVRDISRTLCEASHRLAEEAEMLRADSRNVRQGSVVARPLSAWMRSSRDLAKR